MMPVFLRPGEEQMKYQIHHRRASTNARGRTEYVVETTPFDTLYGSISAARQSEVERFKQAGHPVSHTIVVHKPTAAKAGDALKRGDDIYYIAGKDDLAGLSAFFVLYLNKEEGAGSAQSNA